MGTLTSRLGIDIDYETASGASLSRPSGGRHNSLPEETRNTAAAPVFVIRDLATEIGVESPNSIRSARPEGYVEDSDLIGGGILSSQQASALLAM